MTSAPTIDDNALLDTLQWETFEYFLREVNPRNGLIADKNREGWAASIAATGLALASYPVGVGHGFITRGEAAAVTLTTLQFLRDSEQSTAVNASGYKGFYYHFLEMDSGRRAGQCEVSTVDSAFLIAGALAAAMYFDRDDDAEGQIRALADELYRRVDWQWAQHGKATLTHGYRPRSGFLRYRWEGYDEALLMYVLGLGSPTHPLPAESYAAWLSTYNWSRVYDHELVYAGPLFIHQLSHVFIDFRAIRDAFMREKQIDYFENSRRATYVQREYAVRNPLQFKLYGQDCWGFTASDGPGPARLKVDGVERQFFDYKARGAPYGPDDGTIAPWAVVASLPFAPEIVMPAIRYFHDIELKQADSYGFKATFNPTFPTKDHSPYGWISPWNFGLNQGPIVLMIENHRTGLLWNLMRRCPYIVTGLKRAGFSGGWL